MSLSTLHSISFERVQLPFYGPPGFYRICFSAPWRAGGAHMVELFRLSEILRNRYASKIAATRIVEYGLSPRSSFTISTFFQTPKLGTGS